MLSDASTYRVLHADPTKTYRPLLKSLIDGGVSLGLITHKEADYMIPQHLIMSIFNSFPKIHKEDYPPPFRPIVAGIGSLNENLCSGVDGYLHVLISNNSGYLRDTQQLLLALNDRKWRSGDLWITADVSSLQYYPTLYGITSLTMVS